MGNEIFDRENGVEAGSDTVLPRWSLLSVYPSFDSAEYRRDLESLGEKTARLLSLLDTPLPDKADEAAAALLALIGAADDAGRYYENLHAYTDAVYTTDTRDPGPLREIGILETAALPLLKAGVLFNSRLLEKQGLVLECLESGGRLKPYRYFITTSLESARFMMKGELEDLANDLARSGGDAWERLHGAVSSTASALWDDVTGGRKTVIALRNLACDPDRAVREKAYRAELEAWKSVEIPLAAALNGVKGTAITLDTRRGWRRTGDGGAAASAGLGALRKSAFQSRLGEKTLAALIGVLENSLPVFRRYLRAKAKILGLETCAFYDLFAPLGGNGRKWSWKEAAAFICERFDAFDRRMGDFARRAFSENWIDAEGREGKVGGAYCTGFPLAGESRILCNFAHSFDSVTTVAHELGHGYHHDIIRDLPPSRRSYPMTLAETASIFAETVVFEGALSSPEIRANPAEKLSLIEGNLKDSCQVIVDILSRYYFEKELFDRRDEAELSPAELCGMMRRAQIKTYGDALDPEKLHPYMWAVKSHYYSPHLAFYNYPYAFGLLFSLGLYSRYQKEGSGFAGSYREILRLTGQASAEDAARQAGFDIEGPDFWQNGIGVIEALAEEFERMALAC
ncbi:MAG: M3 family oligoendopeptidase [Treponema sp.]|jgi:pepF/M3 family oligoendopeptidase|nr:M3 family oligoendopeptidase [Treponema sp.]